MTRTLLHIIGGIIVWPTCKSLAQSLFTYRADYKNDDVEDG